MSKTILCADDSATMQTVAKITFTGTDYEYVGARSADEALTKARAKKPVLVLADAVMPGKTGYDLCAELKADPSLADVPVVVVCGNSQAYDPAKGSQVGAAGHVVKPWDTEKLLEKLGEFMKGGLSAPAPAPVAAAPAAKPTPPAAPPKPMAPPMPAPAPAMAARTNDLADDRNMTLMGLPAANLAPAQAPTPPSIAASGTAPAAPRPVARMRPHSVPPAEAVQGNGGVSRPPMIKGTPLRRPPYQPRPTTRALMQQEGVDPNGPEVRAIVNLSQDVIERIVWEVVPDLAEAIIRENLEKLTARSQ